MDQAHFEYNAEINLMDIMMGKKCKSQSPITCENRVNIKNISMLTPVKIELLLDQTPLNIDASLDLINQKAYFPDSVDENLRNDISDAIFKYIHKDKLQRS